MRRSEEWRTSENEMIRHSWDSYGVTLAQLQAWRESGALVGLGAGRADLLALQTGGVREEILVERVTPGLFEVLGVQPELGRLPTGEELLEGAPVLVLSHRLWTERFGADPEVVGRSASLGERPHTVVGVMPAEFRFPRESTLAWTSLEPSYRSDALHAAQLRVVGRIPEGTDPGDVRAALLQATRGLAESNPAYGGIGVRSASLVEEVVGDVRTGLLLLLGTTVTVLLLACLNLANLLLARSARRRSELAARSSGRWPRRRSCSAGWAASWGSPPPWASSTPSSTPWRPRSPPSHGPPRSR